jgi:hypothetical protein
MNQCSMKREFFIEIDDLVDELLSSVRQNGWTISKMQYEICQLTATCIEKRETDGKKVDVTFSLTAHWQDYGDSIELDALVEEGNFDFTDQECKVKCSAVLASIKVKQEKTYQSLYAPQHGLVFDEFESNN